MYPTLLLAQGLTAAVEALERDSHAVGRWASSLWEGRITALIFEQTGGSPLGQTQQKQLTGSVQQPPATSGIELVSWHWKVIRQFVSERFGVSLSCSNCLNWLHRQWFAFKRPRKCLLQAEEVKRESFVVEYAALRQ